MAELKPADKEKIIPKKFKDNQISFARCKDSIRWVGVVDASMR